MSIYIWPPIENLPHSELLIFHSGSTGPSTHMFDNILFDSVIFDEI